MAFDADEPLVHPWVRVDRSVAALVATLGATRHMSMVDLKQLESTRVWNCRKMNPQKKIQILYLVIKHGWKIHQQYFDNVPITTSCHV